VTRYALNWLRRRRRPACCLVAEAIGIESSDHPFLVAACPPTAWGLPTSRATRQQASRSVRRGPRWRRSLELGERSAPMPAGGRRPGRRNSDIPRNVRAHVRYAGTDTALVVPFGSLAEMKNPSEAAHKALLRLHRQRLKQIVVRGPISVEAVGGGRNSPKPVHPATAAPLPRRRATPASIRADASTTPRSTSATSSGPATR